MKKQWLVHMKNDKTTAHSHDKSYGINFGNKNTDLRFSRWNPWSITTLANGKTMMSNDSAFCISYAQSSFPRIFIL